MKPHNRNATLFLILTLIVLGALPVDLILPALPAIASHFGLALPDAALSASLYALGIAAAQPWIGKLVQRWGRKAVLVAGLALSGVAAACIVLVEQGWAMLILRAVQGLGCGTLVLVHHLLSGRGERGRRLLAALALLAALLIAVAPLAGAWLQAHYGWQAVFLAYEFLVLFAVGLMIGVLEDTHSAPQPAPASFRHELAQPGVAGYSVLAGLAFACQFTSLLAIPVVGTLVYALPPSQVSFALLGYGMALLASEAIASVLGQMLSGNNPIRIGLGLVAMASAALALSLREASLAWFLAPLLACTVGTSLVRATACSQALELASDRGAAQALGNSLTFACAGLLSLAALQIEADVRVGVLVLFIAATLVAALLLASVTEHQASDRDAVKL
ncbi:MFS transporter [Pseudomonas sp. KNUC1026]|uniref:MFS transporter n=1 Tax=Pseudomonas sp. KNUC1026 TaxID=2893890 RepID=UPI001F33530E|nr:MFS transporter [Pseudomonas sp. KNUC1026]UFH49642.1 MFS transporter [Pseudomonas sp. KNUC1026]